MSGVFPRICWCARRDIGFSAAPPTDQLVESYRDVRDPSYLDLKTWRSRNFDRVLALVERWQRLGDLFEVGCAYGLFLKVASARGWTACGVEPSRWAVKSGRELYRVNLEVGTLEGSEPPLNASDCVAMFDVLEHLAPSLAALRRCSRWLRLSGILVLTLPNAASWLARLMGNRWLGHVTAHLTCFTQRSVKSALVSGDFELISFGPQPKQLPLGYVAGHLGTGSPLSRVVAGIAKLPWLERMAVPLSTMDSLIVIAKPPNSDKSARAADAWRASGQARHTSTMWTPQVGRRSPTMRAVPSTSRGSGVAAWQAQT